MVDGAFNEKGGLDVYVETLLNNYILFLDKQGVKRAGYIYKVEGSKLAVHSKQVNERGVSKFYYYTLRREDILAVITKEEAIKFASKISN